MATLRGFAVFVVMLGTTSARAQSLAIRGTVVAESGVPIAGATVVATSVGDQRSTAGTSDALGAFTLIVVRDPAGHVVSVSASGYRARQIRVAPNDSAPVLIRLVSSTERLDTVRTVAQRRRPRRAEPGRGSALGADRSTIALADDASGDLSGDLAAALATVPGVSLVPDGSGTLRPNAFGLGADQIGLTMNGLDAPSGIAVPRDGLLATVSLSSYDPKIGRAAGPLVSLALPSGTYAISRTLRATADAPLVRAEPGAEAIGAASTNTIVSGTASGALPGGRRFYDVTAQVGRRASDVRTLATVGDPALLALGASRVDVDRALTIASPLGIAGGRGPGTRATTSAAALARIDFTPGFAPSFVAGALPESGDVFYVLAGGDWRTTRALGASPLATASSLGQATHRGGQLQADYETYRGRALVVLRSGVTATEDRSTPSLAAPAAIVRTGPTSLRFGGGIDASRSSLARWQGSADASWFTEDGAHTVDVYADALVDRMSASLASGSFGAFTYASLDDFAAGQPSAFDRVTGGAPIVGRAVKGALAASDVYRLRRLPRALGALHVGGFGVQYGVRIDMEHYADDRGVSDAARGVGATRVVPNAIAAQPMAGFVWQSGESRVHSGGGFYVEPRHTLTGGVREYRGTLLPSSVAAVLRARAGDDERRLRCVGDAVPLPDWSAYSRSAASIPTGCAGGARVLADSAPFAAWYAPGFGPVRSWREELKWTWHLSGHLVSALGMSSASSVGLPSAVDRNFAATARFTLGDEAGRPVFTDAASLPVATGATTLAGSRATSALGRAIEWHADGRAVQRQTTLGLTALLGTTRVPLSPTALPPRWTGTVSASWTLADAWVRARGFDGTTDGDPTSLAWSAGATPRHAMQLAVSARRPGWAELRLSTRVVSGLPYTPVVRGDPNGDGIENDRAFVFDPAATDDPVVAAAMRTLLDDAPAAARACLRRSLGAIAAPNACRGPWSVPVGVVSLAVDSRRLGLGNRGTVSLQLTNALGGLGRPTVPDDALLEVRGFDAVRRRFRYDVNPRFGRVSPASFLFRQPTTLAIDLRLELGPDRESQAISHLFERAPAGSGVTADADSVRAWMRTYGDIYSAAGDLTSVLARGRALRLTRMQSDTLAALNRALGVARDSIYAELGRYLAARHGAYGGREVRAHWHRAIVDAATQVYETGRSARRILTDAQLTAIQDAPFPLAMLTYSPEWLERIARGPVTSPR